MRDVNAVARLIVRHVEQADERLPIQAPLVTVPRELVDELRRTVVHNAPHAERNK